MQHSKSLFFSLFIHSALFATLFIIYEYIPQKIEAIDEKGVCINLKTIHSQTQMQHTKTSVAKVQTKDIKPTLPVKELIHEKVIQKTLKKQIEIQAMEPEPLPVVAEKEEMNEDAEEEITQIETIEEIQEAVPKRECESSQKTNSYIDNNIVKIALLIQENLYYPRRARKKGIESTVKVKFFLHKDATVSEVSIIASNSDILSRSAIKTITDLSGAFPKPSNELTLTVPISYSLH